jgi:ankyrin repeat protein
MALHCAISGGSLPIIRILIEHGAGVNFVIPGYGNVIDVAAGSGYPDVLGFLLSTAIDIDILRRVSGLEYNAVEVACQHGYISIAKTLVDKGFDIGISLIFAIRNNPEYAKFLVWKGAGVNFTMEQRAMAEGELPLNMACRFGSTSVVKILIDYGADVATRLNSYTPLQSATMNPKGAEDIIHIMLEAGADVNAVGRKLSGSQIDKTALQTAIRMKQAPVV